MKKKTIPLWAIITVLALLIVGIFYSYNSFYLRKAKVISSYVENFQEYDESDVKEIILSTINLPLTILIFAFVPFIVIFTLKKRKKMNKCFMETRVHTSAINSTLENSIAGIRISKAFVAEEYENEKFNKGNNKFKEVRKHSYKVMAEYFAGVNFGVDILDYVVLIAGGIFTYYNTINLGDFLAYMLYVKLFTDPIKKLINFVEQYQNGMTGFKRFIEIMNVEEEKEKNDAIELEKVEGHINFENVCFSYENEKVLDNITLSIEKGKMLALVGPSGGGKTTFCNLIPRFYDATSGEILMLAYMNEEAFRITLKSGKMTYWSRSRNELWVKGLTSGHFQYVKSLAIDCDNDTLLARVEQVGAACHTGNYSCFYRKLEC